MRSLTVQNRTAERELGRHVLLANGFLSRLRGMIGRPEPTPGEGMLLSPSQGVHMWWMKYPLDVALLDRDRRVLAIYPELQPGKRTRVHRGARHALELPAGTLARTGTELGHVLEWSGNGNGRGAEPRAEEGGGMPR